MSFNLPRPLLLYHHQKNYYYYLFMWAYMDLQKASFTWNQHFTTHHPWWVILWWFIIICMDIRVVFCRRTSATYNAKLLCGRLLRLPSAMDGQQQCSAVVVVVAVIIDIQIIIKNYLHFVFCTSCTSRPVSLRINLEAPLGIAGIEEETTRRTDFPAPPSERTFDAWNTWTA